MQFQISFKNSFINYNKYDFYACHLKYTFDYLFNFQKNFTLIDCTKLVTFNMIIDSHYKKYSQA